MFIDSVSNLDEFNIISRVSDKKPNDAGHPIQYDSGAPNSGLFIQAHLEIPSIMVQCMQVQMTETLVIF